MENSYRQHFFLGLLIFLLPLSGFGVELKTDEDSLEYQLIEYETLSGLEIWDSILADNKGKVIYGNLSGTWCAPCEHYFSLSDSLHKVFNDQDVSFIYIWFHSKKEKIIEFTENYQLSGTHYIVSKEQGEAIQEMLNRLGFPTYYLINRKGEIVTKDAPRPGSAEVFDRLNQLLDE